MRECIGCGETKPYEDFSPVAGYKHMRRRARCRACCTIDGKKHQATSRARNVPGHTARVLTNNAKHRAARFGLPFDLDRQWVEEQFKGPCPVTGLEFRFEPGSPFAPSIDQREPARGYTRENAQVVVWIYNAAKQDFTHEDVLRFARALVSQ